MDMMLPDLLVVLVLIAFGWIMRDPAAVVSWKRSKTERVDSAGNVTTTTNTRTRVLGTGSSTQELTGTHPEDENEKLEAGS